MFEHYQLPTYKDVSIIVRDRDLGSIISYSLTTPEYEQKLSAIKSEMEAKSNVINESVKVTAETNEKNKMNDCNVFMLLLLLFFEKMDFNHFSLSIQCEYHCNVCVCEYHSIEFFLMFNISV